MGIEWKYPHKGAIPKVNEYCLLGFLLFNGNYKHITLGCRRSNNMIDTVDGQHYPLYELKAWSKVTSPRWPRYKVIKGE